eukprot:s584_g4.t1
MQEAQERLERENEDLPLENGGPGVEREQEELVAVETSIVASEKKGEKESEAVEPVPHVSISTPPAVVQTPGNEKGKVSSAVSPAVAAQASTQDRAQEPVRATPSQVAGTSTPIVNQPLGNGDGMGSATNGPSVGPAGTPQTPLFTSEQLLHWRMLEEQAPLLMPRRLDMAYNMPLQRPQFMEFEEARLMEERRRHEEERRRHEELRQYMEVLVKENQKLSKRVEELEGREEYHTPDQRGISKDAADPQKDAVDPQKEAVDPQKEAVGPPKEAVGPPKEAVDPQKDSEAPWKKFEAFSKEAADPQRFEDRSFPKMSGGRRPPQDPPKEAADPLRFEDQSFPKMSGGRRPPQDPPKEAERPPKGSTEEKPSSQRDFTEKSLEFMALMVDSMKEMQRKMTEGREEQGMVKGMEIVRSGIPDLPLLPPWNPTSGPLQLGDWLLMVGPLVADMSASSEEWWRLTIKEAEAWYKTHMQLSPLEKIQHGHTTPSCLQDVKWQRLERRVSVMVLQSVPEQIKEELVASRRLEVFGIITYLHLIYSPGGVTEKQLLLKTLEDPAEVTVLSEAPGALRKWLRWKRRTLEIGAIPPDPTLLLKGLNRLVRKVVEPNRELQFRISLVRSSLGVDTTPSDLNITQFANHLLAELEQASLSEKRTPSSTAKDQAKLKRIEDSQGSGEGKSKEKGEEGQSRERQRCKFFFTDSGCRKGKECRFLHDITKEEMAEKRRCWTCGAIDHLSPSCPRKSGSESPKRGKAIKVEAEKIGQAEKEGSGAEASQASTMKGLLEEASKLLKSYQEPASPTSSASSAKEDSEGGARKEVLERLHEQIKSMKTFKISQLGHGSQQGLIDSGATHPLRPQRRFEDVTAYPTVQVQWSDDGISITHPRRGLLPVWKEGGCPQIPRALAMELIEELEEVGEGVRLKGAQLQEEFQWMCNLIDTHPVFSQLPKALREALKVHPGPSEGFTLARAMKQQGSDPEEILEVDLVKGKDHDVLSNDGVFGALLTASFQGKLKGIIGGPNCRTRSILRHFPVPGRPMAPRPIRRWGGEEFGIVDATEDEKKKLFEDDLLLWRMVLLYAVSEYVRVAMEREGKIWFAMEQPASPRQYNEDVVSIWDTKEWKAIAKEFDLHELTYNQKDLGGKASKRTTFSTNMNLELSGNYMKCQSQGEVENSKELSRWSPGPLKRGKDADSSQSKYFLCGALVWAVPAGTEKMKQPDEVEDEEAPMIEDEVRKTLKAASVGPEFWPLALRHVNAINRSIRRNETPNWPPFLSDVVVRKRRWNRDDFRPTMEVAKYVAPSKEDHGHWIIGENGQVRLTRCVLRKVEDVPTEGQWVAIEKEIEDAQTLRRRLRHKAAVRRLEGEVEESEEKRRKDMIWKVIEEESKFWWPMMKRPSWMRCS